MNRIFLISDSHLNHCNIISYCNRPFKDAYEMNKEIIKSWNKVVNNEDIVYHLGDFGFGNKEQIIEWVKSMNGRIRLVLGNHDNHPVKWYLDCGFDRVYDKSIIIQEKYILSHAPIEFSSNLGPFKNIHGHVHNDIDYLAPTSQRLNVSCEVLDYVPITIEEAIKRMERAKK